MIKLKGKYNTAKVFTDNVDNTTISQVMELCNQKFVQGEVIRIMPDCHAGAGCVIGTTMTLKNGMAVPNTVGVDIGCGMEVMRIAEQSVDLAKLDEVIKNKIPSGFSIRSTPHRYAEAVEYDEIIAKFDKARALKSIGTLGGGNHFIEMNKDEDGNFYLVIHSGSRNLGKQVAEYWQKEAIKQHASRYNFTTKEIILINQLYGRERSTEEDLKAVEKPPQDALCYLWGASFHDYISDMKIVQKYAYWNRKAMMDEITLAMGFTPVETFTTIHNYIDTDQMILRKGAVSAKLGEKLIIPINMRDGSIVALGKGNSDWNYSAPHGAGRLMARGEAKRNLTLEEFQKEMQGVYSTTVNQSTLDESPMAYKSKDEIIQNIQDTVIIDKIIKPIYNYKNAEG